MWNSFQTRGPGYRPFSSLHSPYHQASNPPVQVPEGSFSGIDGGSSSPGFNFKWLATAASVGVPLATSLMNNLFQSSANKRNAALYRQYLDWQRESQVMSQNYNAMMWHMNNRYNSPANQMALLRQAGLNPNLMYGGFQGNAQAPSSPSPSASAPGNIYNPLSMSLGNPAETYMAERQLSMQEQSTALLNEEQRLKNKQLQFDVEHQEDKYNLDTKQQNVTISEIEARTKNLIQSLDNLKEQKGILAEQKKQAIIKTFVDENTKEALVRKVIAEADFTEVQVKYYRRLIDEIAAKIQMYNSQGRYYRALAKGQENYNKWFETPSILGDDGSVLSTNGFDLLDSQSTLVYNEAKWSSILSSVQQKFMETEIAGMTQQQKYYVWSMILGTFNSASHGAGAAGLLLKAVK